MRYVNNLSHIELACFAWASGPGRPCLGETGMASLVKVRVPHPQRRLKERLDAPPERAHRVKKRYRRRPKHPKRSTED